MKDRVRVTKEYVIEIPEQDRMRIRWEHDKGNVAIEQGNDGIMVLSLEAAEALADSLLKFCQEQARQRSGLIDGIARAQAQVAAQRDQREQGTQPKWAVVRRGNILTTSEERGESMGFESLKEGDRLCYIDNDQRFHSVAEYSGYLNTWCPIGWRPTDPPKKDDGKFKEEGRGI